MAFSPGSRGRLTDDDLGRFPADTLFDRIGRAVCAAGCLPRKELYEAWEVARRARRLFRGGRVVDLGCGHGLLAHVMLLLDDSSPEARGGGRGAAAIGARRARGAGRARGRASRAASRWQEASLEDVPLTPQ